MKGIDKQSRGKEQFRIEEARRVVAVALAQARKPASGQHRDAQHRESSLAVLVALYLGMRASEVVSICRRDVDARGRLLWIPDSKTENGRRTLEVADVLRPMLWERAQARGDDPDARLFAHDRGWVLYNVKRLCRAAKVPEVTAHGARGIHATIATQMGTTSHIVALALGHGSAEVTRRHYIRPGASEQASQARLEQLITTSEAEPAALPTS